MASAQGVCVGGWRRPLGADNVELVDGDERDSPVKATTNAAPPLTAEASTSWRYNLLFATLICPGDPG
jgi:hypothetical protein